MKFVIREVDGDVNRIVFPNAAIFYYLMWPAIGVAGLAYGTQSNALAIAAGMLWFLVICVAVPTWGASVAWHASHAGGNAT